MKKPNVEISTGLLNHLEAKDKKSLARLLKRKTPRERLEHVKELIVDAVNELDDSEACEAVEWLPLAFFDAASELMEQHYWDPRAFATEQTALFLSDQWRLLLKSGDHHSILSLAKSAFLRHIALGHSDASEKTRGELLRFFRQIVIVQGESVAQDDMLSALRTVSNGKAKPEEIAELIMQLSQHHDASRPRYLMAKDAIPILAHGLVRNMEPKRLGELMTAIAPLTGSLVRSEVIKLIGEEAARLEELDTAASDTVDAVVERMKTQYSGRGFLTKTVFRARGRAAVVSLSVSVDEDRCTDFSRYEPFMNLVIDARNEAGERRQPEDRAVSPVEVVVCVNDVRGECRTLASFGENTL